MESSPRFQVEFDRTKFSLPGRLRLVPFVAHVGNGPGFTAL